MKDPETPPDDEHKKNPKKEVPTSEHVDAPQQPDVVNEITGDTANQLDELKFDDDSLFESDSEIHLDDEVDEEVAEQDETEDQALLKLNPEGTDLNALFDEGATDEPTPSISRQLGSLAASSIVVAKRNPGVVGGSATAAAAAGYSLFSSNVANSVATGSLNVPVGGALTLPIAMAVINALAEMNNSKISKKDIEKAIKDNIPTISPRDVSQIADQIQTLIDKQLTILSTNTATPSKYEAPLSAENALILEKIGDKFFADIAQERPQCDEVTFARLCSAKALELATIVRNISAGQAGNGLEVDEVKLLQRGLLTASNDVDMNKVAEIGAAAGRALELQKLRYREMQMKAAYAAGSIGTSALLYTTTSASLMVGVGVPLSIGFLGYIAARWWYKSYRNKLDIEHGFGADPKKPFIPQKSQVEKVNFEDTAGKKVQDAGAYVGSGIVAGAVGVWNKVVETVMPLADADIEAAEINCEARKRDHENAISNKGPSSVQAQQAKQDFIAARVELKRLEAVRKRKEIIYKAAPRVGAFAVGTTIAATVFGMPVSLSLLAGGGIALWVANRFIKAISGN